MGQPIIIVPPQPSDENDNHVQEASDAAVESAAISTSAAGTAVTESASAGEAASTATEAAVVSTEAASNSVSALEAIRAELSTLTERISLVMNHPPTSGDSSPELPPEGGVLPEENPAGPPQEERQPIKRTPDKAPTESHWYIKSRGKKK